MVSRMMEINITSRERNEMLDITDLVRRQVKASGISEGIMIAQVMHTTAGLTVNENADPDVQHDLLLQWETLAPLRRDFRHGEGNSDAHVKASMTGCSLTLLVSKNQPVLGTWQGIYFCEFDGPRQRKVMMRVLGE